MSAPATEQLVVPPPTTPGRLHRPARAIVALVELLLAGAAVWGAFWAWPHGFATITAEVGQGIVVESERVYGNWVAAAIAFGTVAAILVLDAARQAVLAVRARPKRVKKSKDTGTDTDSDTDAEADTEPPADTETATDAVAHEGER
ncbi:MAG: hypothetical protein ACRDSK_16390 [Actinophytocola sp.]|uniref:hypothetical protein n=1 Tax=Actinophytocola sp. TaxID=1872138 RepID=UPI003D6B3689